MLRASGEAEERVAQPGTSAEGAFARGDHGHGGDVDAELAPLQEQFLARMLGGA